MSCYTTQQRFAQTFQFVVKSKQKTKWLYVGSWSSASLWAIYMSGLREGPFPCTLHIDTFFDHVFVNAHQQQSGNLLKLLICSIFIQKWVQASCQIGFNYFSVKTTPSSLSRMLSLRYMFQRTSAWTYPVLWIFWWKKNVFVTCIAHRAYNPFLIEWELRHLRQDNQIISTIDLKPMQFHRSQWTQKVWINLRYGFFGSLLTPDDLWYWAIAITALVKQLWLSSSWG